MLYCHHNSTINVKLAIISKCIKKYTNETTITAKLKHYRKRIHSKFSVGVWEAPPDRLIYKRIDCYIGIHYVFVIHQVSFSFRQWLLMVVHWSLDWLVFSEDVESDAGLFHSSLESDWTLDLILDWREFRPYFEQESSHREPLKE